MVRNVSTLAAQALRTQQSLQAQLTRIHHGFVPKSQIAAAQKAVYEILTMLQEMEKAISSPPSPPEYPAIPLK
jgi:hypothetical protein